MPVHRTILSNGKLGWQWGNSGKKYATKQEAQTQMKAIFANGYKGGKQAYATLPIIASLAQLHVGGRIGVMTGFGKQNTRTQNIIHGAAAAVMAANLIGAIAGGIAKRRTPQEQLDRNDSIGATAARVLVPGVAAYDAINQLKPYPKAAQQDK